MNAQERAATDFLILTGMSGAGRSTVANALEDHGWLVVDNLPPELLGSLATVTSQPDNGKHTPIAVVIDARSRFFVQLRTEIITLREQGWNPQIVYLDATDENIVRRFESTRRPHPLQGSGPLLEGIHRERETLTEIRAIADYVIDTSNLNLHQLSRKVDPLFAIEDGPALRLAVMSFGFKYGLPLDADFVFDMRFLPNPFWRPELRELTGLDDAVAEFVMAQPGATEFTERLIDLMSPVIDGYVAEGRQFLTLAIGCTGGKHRSVAVAQQVASLLRSDNAETFVIHRDLGQE